MSFVETADLPFLLSFAGGAVVVTTASALTFGRVLARRSRPLAIATSASVAPLLVTVLAFAGLAVGGAEAGYLFRAILVLAAIALPVSVATAAVLLRRRTRRGSAPL